MVYALLSFPIYPLSSRNAMFEAASQRCIYKHDELNSVTAALSIVKCAE